jgi:hypothetical protein
VTAAETCRRAAQVLRERGWRQSSLGMGEHGPVCALGALNVARGNPPELGSFDLDDIAAGGDEVGALVATLIAEGWLTGREHADPWLVVAYNDRKGQTAEGVIGLYERTAARLEAAS